MKNCVCYGTAIRGVHVFLSSLRNFASNNVSSLIKVSIVCLRARTQKDTTLKRFDKVKNPNLVVLADFQNGKIYLKRADGSLWLFAHSDKGTVWIKLHNYIMEILEALSIFHHRRFDNFIPKQIWVNRNLKARMLKMLRILKNEGMLTNRKN